MKIGNFDLNHIYCADCYEAIKDIPDKSVDCIYSDIPYLYDQGGSGNSKLGERTARKRLRLMGIDDSIAEKNSITYGELLKRAKNGKCKRERASIEDGIDYKIYDEFCRVMKHINCFIWCSKLQLLDTLNYFMARGGGYYLRS